MANNKSIAFLCHPYHRGGVTRWMADAAIAYADKGYTVYFATLEPTITFFSGEGRETMLQLLTRTKNSVITGRIKVGREFEFGTPEYLEYIYKKTLLATVPRGVPVILSDDKSVWAAAVSLHQTYPIVGVLHADENAYYELTRKYHKLTDILVSVSARVERTVKERYPDVPADKLFVIPCGIHLPPVNQRSHKEDTLQLIYVGRVNDYQKRSGDLLKIAASLREKNISFNLNIIGDGAAYKTNLEKQFKDAGLNDSVTFRGWLSQAEVKDYLQKADVMILPSDFEGMPIAMMEALASGCGFVGTRVSGIEDYENDALAQDCFRVYEIGDIEDAVNKIQQVAAMPLAARHKAARQLAESQFSMDNCLANYDKAIATIKPRSYSAGSASMSPVAILKSRLTAIARAMKVKSSR